MPETLTGCSIGGDAVGLQPLVDDDVGAGDVEAGRHGAQHAHRGIIRHAVVDGGADDEIVVVIPDRIGEFSLQAAADRVGVGGGEIGLAIGVDRAYRDGAGRHHVAVRIEQHVGGIEVGALEAKKGGVVGAGPDVGGVAVDQMLMVMPVVDVAAQQDVVGRPVGRGQLKELRLVLDRLGKREDAGAVGLQQLDRRRAGGAQGAVGGRAGNMDGEVVPFPAQIEIALRDPAAIELAIAIVMDAPEGAVETDIADLHPAFGEAGHVAKRAARGLHVGAVEVEAVLHVQRHRAAERVEAEHGVVALDRHPIDRELRDQFPVDDIAERLVDAHAVLIHRETLRHAGDRRRLEAAIDEIGLIGAALLAVEIDAREIARGRAGHEIVRAVAVQRAAAQRLDVGRHLVEIDAAARQRRVADDRQARQENRGSPRGVRRGIVGRRRLRAGRMDRQESNTDSGDAGTLEPQHGSPDIDLTRDRIRHLDLRRRAIARAGLPECRGNFSRITSGLAKSAKML